MKSQHICLKLFRGKKQKSHYVELVFGLCQGFPHRSVGKESICNSGDPGLIPGLERSAGEERLPTPVFLASLVAQLVKNLPAMWETWVQSLSWKDSLEKGKAAAAKLLQSCLTLCNPRDGSLPWDSPGKNTGVGCHFLLQCMRVKSESEVGQSCLILHHPVDCSPPGSSVHGIFQARVLEQGAIAFFH